MRVQNRQNVSIQTIITELLFQHALRIRVKSEAVSGEADTPSENGTSDTAAHLTGRLNNLVTGDLENIKIGNPCWIPMGAC